MLTQGQASATWFWVCKCGVHPVEAANGRRYFESDQEAVESGEPSSCLNPFCVEAQFTITSVAKQRARCDKQGHDWKKDHAHETCAWCGDVRVPVQLNHESIQQIGRYRETSLAGIDPDIARKLWLQMLRIRRMEEALLREYHPANEMRCPMHFCIGQEAIPAALSLLMEPEDYLFSHHRSHGYYFAKGAPMRELFAECYGRSTGSNSGIAGSQDISHDEYHFYSGAILAGGVSLATGAALAFQYRKTKQIAISAFGEGATEEGAFWEAVNYAGVRKLPILFICENNRYATYSDQLKRQHKDNITERVATFGVRSRRIFGNDAPLAYRTLKHEISQIRSGAGPSLVEAYTYRWNSHVGPEDDNFNNYRAKWEFQFWKDNCPIRLLESLIGLEIEAKEQIDQEIADSFRFAKESPLPDSIPSPINSETPLADRILGVATGATFNHDQPEAKLEPY